MEIDDNLKNRLAGVAVVTVLAVIFLPMLFEAPAEKKPTAVSEKLDIPQKTEVSPLLNTQIIPDKTAAVVAPNNSASKEKTGSATEVKIAKAPAESAAPATTTLSNAELKAEKNSLSEEEMETEAPSKKSQTKAVNTNQEEELVKEEKIDQPKEDKLVKKHKAELPVLDIDEIGKSKTEDSPSVHANRRWTIQVASLTDANKAIELRDKLRSQGFPANIIEAQVKGKRVYRLKVGPDLDAEKAQAMKSKINELNNVNSIAIPE